MARETAAINTNYLSTNFIPRLNQSSAETGLDFHTNIYRQPTDSAVDVVEESNSLDPQLKSFSLPNQTERPNVLIKSKTESNTNSPTISTRFGYVSQKPALSQTEASNLAKDNYSNERMKANFKQSVLNALKEQPVDDGEFHTIDEILENLLLLQKEIAWDFIQNVFQETYEASPKLCADFIHGVSRVTDELEEKILPKENNYSLLTLALAAILSKTPRLRESGLRILDSINDPNTIEMLKDYLKVEREFWLKEYATRIIANLLQI